MYQITFTSLERLLNYLNSIPKDARNRNTMSSVEHTAIVKRLTSMKAEATVLYSLTLRYPIISVHPSEIKWIIKNALPTQAEILKFHDEEIFN